jgi:hypothetical protein
MGSTQDHTARFGPSFLGADPWSKDCICRSLGPEISQRAAAARSQRLWRWLVHRKDIMNRQKILIEHWRWLQVNGSKQQAASCKLQAASLTRKNYRIIKEYESKNSKTNYR